MNPLRGNIEIPGLPVPHRVQDPNPSEVEVSLDTTALCLFPFHPQSMGTFPTLLLVNALGAKLYHVCSSSWTTCKLSTWLGPPRRLGVMITFRQSPWNIPGFLQAQPNAGLRMLNRLPLQGQPSPHFHTLLTCTPVAPEHSSPARAR